MMTDPNGTVSYIHNQHIITTHGRRKIKPQDSFGNKFGYASHMLFLQMSAKKGIDMFGDRAIAAITISQGKGSVYSEKIS